MSTLAITVHGLPAPQGSKRHVGHGVMIESSKAVKPWREAVKWAAIQARIADDERVDGSPFCVPGPVRVEMTFTLPRPKSAPKRRIWPDRKPDLDKVIRATLDALKDAGVYEDDARVISITATKVYPGEMTGGLPVPGAVIRVCGLLAEGRRG